MEPDSEVTSTSRVTSRISFESSSTCQSRFCNGHARVLPTKKGISKYLMYGCLLGAETSLGESRTYAEAKAYKKDGKIPTIRT
jgi:hypothetical protein